MRKFLFGAVLGLAIITGYLTTASTASAVTLHNNQTGLCLAVVPKYPYPGVPQSYPGAPVIVWTCDGTQSQEWGQIFFTSVSNLNGYALFFSDDFTSYAYNPVIDGIATNLHSADFYLSNGLASLAESGLKIASSSVLGVKAAVMKNGTPLIQWGMLTDINQHWQAVPIGSDFNGHTCYIFKNDANPTGGQPYVMGVAGGNPSRGTQVVIWQLIVDAYGNPDYRGHPDQYWCVY